MRYVALLRGINVGGKNKIAMPDLRAAFEQAGFTGVETYINSGNVLFSTESIDTEAITLQCKTLLQEKFNIDTSVAVISAPDLLAAMENAPAWWNQDADAKHNAIFVISPATAEDIIAEVGAHKPEYEQVGSYSPIIFWTAPVKTFSRTRWPKVVGTSVYSSITIRNANTANKLVELLRRP